MTRVMNRSWSWSGNKKVGMTGAQESDGHMTKSKGVCQSCDKGMTNKGRL